MIARTSLLLEFQSKLAFRGGKHRPQDMAPATPRPSLHRASGSERQERPPYIFNRGKTTRKNSTRGKKGRRSGGDLRDEPEHEKAEPIRRSIGSACLVRTPLLIEHHQST